MIKYAVFLFLASCSSMDGLRCFNIDGKASSWCQRGLRADRMCSSYGGTQSVQFGESVCKDGSKVKVD